MAAAARHIDGPVRVDLDPDRREIAAWAEAHGLPQVAETAFMVRGTPWPPPASVTVSTRLSPSRWASRGRFQRRKRHSPWRWASRGRFQRRKRLYRQRRPAAAGG